MSGYDSALTISYTLALVNFATTPTARAIKPPRIRRPGASNAVSPYHNLDRGAINDIHAAVTVTFTQTTTPGFVRLGTTGDNDYFAELNMGAAATTDAYNLRDAGNIFKIIDIVNDSVIGAISQVEVTLVAPTGGTPAGTADLAIVISWF